jgi:MFS family permease
MSDFAAPVRAQVAAVSPARIFWASWSGWMLDGFDSGIYLFVLVPALSELLRLQGIEVSKANIALYGGYLFTIFMLGWACSMFWGAMADRFGRVRIMCLTILTYSVFTGLCGLSYGLLSFAVFRFLAGFGIGGEWAAGTPLLHESVPEALRVRYAGWLHTATPVGNLLAAIASFLIPLIGWRGLFLIGVLPAFLTLYLRLRVPEPARWQRSEGETKGGAGLLFRPPWSRNTWAAAGLMACIIFGLWSSTYWAPTLVLTKLTEAGAGVAYAQRMASATGVFMNLGTLTACLAMPFVAAAIGRRRATAMLFLLGAFVMNLVGYLGAASLLNNVMLFLLLIPVLGFFTNGIFSLTTIWLPEMFPTSQRAFGSGFAFSLGRLLGAAGPLIVGSVTAMTGSYPLAIASISVIYLIGLPAVWLAPETAGKGLPS